MWYLFWLIFAYEKPSHSRWVSDSELEYIEILQGDDTTDYEVCDSELIYIKIQNIRSYSHFLKLIMNYQMNTTFYVKEFPPNSEPCL